MVTIAPFITNLSLIFYVSFYKIESNEYGFFLAYTLYIEIPQVLSLLRFVIL